MIATCNTCHRLMTGTSCDPRAFRVGGVTHLRKRWGDDWQDILGERVDCHDCFVTVGGYHHVGCAMDECPHGQASFCDQCEIVTSARTMTA